MNANEESVKLDSLIALWNVEKEQKRDTLVASSSDPYNFNPNSIGAEDFTALGFSPPVAGRIIRYREKGGKFRTKSDLLKIFGMDTAFYRRIQAFILLPEKENKVTHFVKKYPVKKYPNKEVARTKKVLEKFDLNLADTSQLKKIYGIGDKLSLRIIKYRDVLGGFINMEQLKEVYGLDSVTIRQIAENSVIAAGFQPAKVNLNTASEKQLAQHPYLKKVAKAVVSYRFQHGDYKSVEEIQNVIHLDDKILQKIGPYLKVREGE